MLAQGVEPREPQWPLIYSQMRYPYALYQHVTDHTTWCSPRRGNRARTCDLMLPKHARYQLRHTPKNHPRTVLYRPPRWALPPITEVSITSVYQVLLLDIGDLRSRPD